MLKYVLCLKMGVRKRGTVFLLNIHLSEGVFMGNSLLAAASGDMLIISAVVAVVSLAIIYSSRKGGFQSGRGLNQGGRALKLYKVGDYAGALVLFDAALSSVTDKSIKYNYLLLSARCAMELGDYDRSQSCIDRAETLAPKRKLTYKYRAMLAAAICDFAGAEAAYRKQAAEFPSSEPYLDLHSHFLSHADFEQAKKALLDGLKLFPRDSKLNLALVQLMLTTGDSGGALGRMQYIRENKVRGIDLAYLQFWANDVGHDSFSFKEKHGKQLEYALEALTKLYRDSYSAAFTMREQTSSAHTSPAASRIGGRAAMHEDEEFPTGMDGLPLKCLVQINLSELYPPIREKIGLPDSGLLQLFGSDDLSESRLCLRDDSASLKFRGEASPIFGKGAPLLLKPVYNHVQLGGSATEKLFSERVGLPFAEAEKHTTFAFLSEGRTNTRTHCLGGISLADDAREGGFSNLLLELYGSLNDRRIRLLVSVKPDVWFSAHTEHLLTLENLPEKE